MVFGPLADVKLWFIGLCWLVVMIPWVFIGYLGRRILRNHELSCHTPFTANIRNKNRLKKQSLYRQHHE